MNKNLDEAKQALNKIDIDQISDPHLIVQISMLALLIDIAEVLREQKQ